MTTKAASVSTDVMPTKGQETELHATTACRVELTKGAVLYGAGGVLTATLVDQLLQANSLRWRQFSNGQHKLLLLGAVAVATSWFGSYRYEHACRDRMRSIYEQQVLKVEGAPSNARITSTTATSNKSALQ